MCRQVERRSVLDFLLARASAERVAHRRKHRSQAAIRIKTRRTSWLSLLLHLMTTDTEFDRSPLWELLHNDHAVRHAIVDKLAEEDWNAGKSTKKASVPELVDLFIWAEERYPTSEDPQVDGGSGLSTRDQIVYWRNGLVEELRRKDRQEALHGIRHILFRFPHLEGLQRMWLDLEKATEGSKWKPFSPKGITTWLSSHQRPRRRKIAYVWQSIKRHRKTIFTVVWFGIRRLSGS